MAKSEFIRHVFNVLSAFIAKSSREYSGEYYLTPLGPDADEILIRDLKQEFAL